MVAESGQPNPVDAKLVTIAMAFIAVFVPFLISITPMSDAIYMMASAWMLDINRGQVRSVYFGPTEWAAMSPLTFIRLIFVFQISRYYGGKSTRKRTVIVGILTELPLWVSFLLLVLPSWGIWITFSMPLPFLLVAGVMLVWRYPRLEVENHWEEQGEAWWSRQNKRQS
jgi:hypothetical protein